jgi:hypothetical protein
MKRVGIGLSSLRDATLRKHRATFGRNIPALNRAQAEIQAARERLMVKFSPRFFLSPRFFALPFIALAVIVTLAQAHRGKPIGSELASAVVRATTCATPGRAVDAACAIARADTSRVLR